MRGSNSWQQVNKKKKQNASSNYFGVTWHKQKSKWLARVTVNYKAIHIGSFEDEKDAGIAVIKALVRHWGTGVRIEDQKKLGLHPD